MPRSLAVETQTALAERRLVARDFVWFVARSREDGTPVTEGLWSDVGNVSAQIINPDTGATQTRSWYGSGTLVTIDDIPLLSNLTVQTVGIRLSQVDDRIAQLVRTYDCQQARVEIYRGLFDPASRVMVAPAEARFVGFVDRIEITTPREGEEGGVLLTCTSHTQEMTRANPDTRSDASQRQRSSNDRFFQDAGTATEWEVWWGSTKGVVTTAKRKKFLGIF